MKINWNFLRGGGGGCKTKNLPLGEYGYFVELHNVSILENVCLSDTYHREVSALESCQFLERWISERQGGTSFRCLP